MRCLTTVFSLSLSDTYMLAVKLIINTPVIAFVLAGYSPLNPQSDTRRLVVSLMRPALALLA